jgi:nitronate monooxygenase
MWQTKITEMLGIEYPIIQGAYGGFGTSVLAGPVSEVGGLGIITASALRTPERLKEDIAKARAMTDKPIGVNLSPGMLPNIDDMVKATIEQGIKVVETAGGSSEIYGRRLKEAGVVWIHKVATVRHAVSAEKQGADAVVIVGIEGAGGKSSIQVPTLINIPLATKVLKIPVIAAGGIGDARSFMAALAMGAEAVYMGTAFMATKECPISDRYKQSIVDRSAFEPAFRARVLAPPGAMIVEMVPQEGGAPIHETDEDGRRISGVSLAVAAVDKVITVKELIQEMITGAEVIRRRWALS